MEEEAKQAIKTLWPDAFELERTVNEYNEPCWILWDNALSIITEGLQFGDDQHWNNEERV